MSNKSVHHTWHKYIYKESAQSIMKRSSNIPQSHQGYIGDDILTFDPENTENDSKNKRTKVEIPAIYELEKIKKKTLLIIVNHGQYIDNDDDMTYIHNFAEYIIPVRSATHKDIRDLRNTFAKFGFDVTVHYELDKEKLMANLQTFSQNGYKDCGCLFIAVLGYVLEDGIFKSTNFTSLYSESDIRSCFENQRSFTSNPIVLIVQVFRHSSLRLTSSVTYNAEGEVMNWRYEPPLSTNMLILHSSQPDSVVFNDEPQTPWLIKELCKHITSHAPTHDLQSIITKMRYDIATNGIYSKTQMPVTASTLIAKLYLGKYEGQRPDDQEMGNVVLDNTNGSAILNNDRKDEPKIGQEMGTIGLDNSNCSNNAGKDETNATDVDPAVHKDEERQNTSELPKATEAAKGKHKSPGLINTRLNARALPKNAKTYQLETFEKNALIIFNQENFDKNERRIGTQKDVDALTETFERFGFEVDPHNDLTKEHIFGKLDEFIARDFTDYGCVAIAILTHGSYNGLLRARDMQYSEDDIKKYFLTGTRPTLVTKPKIIIIQACRGSTISPAEKVYRGGRIQQDHDNYDGNYTLPVASDILVIHSCYEGAASSRDIDDGSWFIQELCRQINLLSSKQDLESIVTEVKRRIALLENETFNPSTQVFDIHKQMLVPTTTLIRKLFLRKFGDPPPLLEDGGEETGTNRRRPGGRQLKDSSDSVVSSMNYFHYMKKCLTHFKDDYPNNEEADRLFDDVITLEENPEFNRPKEEMSKMIEDFLKKNAKHCQFFKYIQFNT